MNKDIRDVSFQGNCARGAASHCYFFFSTNCPAVLPDKTLHDAGRKEFGFYHTFKNLTKCRFVRPLITFIHEERNATSKLGVVK